MIVVKVVDGDVTRYGTGTFAAPFAFSDSGTCAVE
jgi:hypothetical protein